MSVVDDDGSTEKVFKYTIGGSYLGSWEIGDAALEEPRGITTDPSALSDAFWIVDKKSDKVYQFHGGTIAIGTIETADAMFALAAKGDAERIADPPSRAHHIVKRSSEVAAANTDSSVLPIAVLVQDQGLKAARRESAIVERCNIHASVQRPAGLGDLGDGYLGYAARPKALMLHAFGVADSRQVVARPWHTP